MSLLHRVITATAPAKRSTATEDALRRHFKIDFTFPSLAFENARRLGRVRTALSTMTGARDAVYECEAGATLNKGLCADHRYGVSLWSIHLCPHWWSMGKDDQALALIHEWGHKWGVGINRVFETYCWEAGYGALSGDSRTKMPDAFTSYIAEVVLGRRTICWI